MFHDRVDAGKKLASLLAKYKGKDCVVLAIPRGGVVIADEICKVTGFRLGLLINKKISAPYEEEMAIGSVAEDGTAVFDERVISEMRIREDYIEKEKEEKMKEIRRRSRVYMEDRLEKNVEGRIAIIVDDGVATGLSMLCAIRYIMKKKPAKVVVAVAVAPKDSVEELKKEADDVIVIETPETLYAIGEYYDNFEQLEDDQVVKILNNYVRK